MAKCAWLIRHGQSESNAGLATSHTAQIPLTALGQQQAMELPQAFASPPDLLVASSYLRAQQTAVPSRERFPDVAFETWPIHEFFYLCPTRCDGTTLEQRQPLVREYWQRCDPDHRDGPDNESFREFMARLDGFWQQVFEADVEFLAVFAHGHVMRALLWKLWSPPRPIDALSMKQFRGFLQAVPVANGAILPFFHHQGQVTQVAPFRLEHLSSPSL